MAGDQLKTTEAATVAGVSDRTIRTWIKEGHLPATRGEDGIRRVARADLLAHLAERARAVAGPIAVSAPDAAPEVSSDVAATPEAAPGPTPDAAASPEAAPDRASDPEIARALALALETIGRLTKENVDLAWRAGHWEAEARRHRERVLLLESGPVAEPAPEPAPEAAPDAAAEVAPATEAASASRRWWAFWKKGG